VGGEQAVGVRFEPRAGGRIVETVADGRECVWGTIDEWSPGERLRFSWHPGRGPETAQWVEVAFAPNPAGTRVTLTHGGWERLGERAATVRENYVTGWSAVVVARYGPYCAGRAVAEPRSASKRDGGAA
jgi:hypothetical protein